MIRFMKFQVFGLAFLHFLITNSAHAAYPYPYSMRTQAFSGWNTAVRGDINTVGMAGATVAIPYSISSAEYNPSGFAMSISSLSAQLNKASVHDGNLQKSGANYEINEWGVALSPPPWGFGISYYSPSSESGSYLSPLTGHELITEISVRELRATVARAFLMNRLAVGLSIEMERGLRKLGMYSQSGTSWGVQLGALYRLDDHIVLGLSALPGTTIDGAADAGSQGEVENFFQRIESPTVISSGVAWIPNRFFKTGFSLQFIGTTPGAALLADQTKMVGGHLAIEPRLGASYVLAEYQNFKMEYAAGIYYEPTRILRESSRMHGTMGLEFNPYFINTGIGFDLAKDYRNVMISIGIDIVRTLRTFEIVPKDPVPAYQGFFPSAMEVSADGLPEGMTQGEYKKSAPATLDDVGMIISAIPEKIQKRVNGPQNPLSENTRQKRNYHRLRRRHLSESVDENQSSADGKSGE